MTFKEIFYGGNGTVSVDSGLPRVGVMFGIEPDGDLRWYRCGGNGEADRSGATGWHPNSGSAVGNGWQNFRQVMGGGDGVVFAIAENGNLLWYRYDGEGEPGHSGGLGWHPNSGNPIGRGFDGFIDVFCSPHQGRNSPGATIWGVTPDGDLRWYRYRGHGEADETGSIGWDPNSGNVVGNGWQNFLHIFSPSSVIFAIGQEGELRWYSYGGNGEADRSGATGWQANSGNHVGHGWENFREVFSGFSDAAGAGSVVYAVADNGDLLWYRYSGDGTHDPAGALNWHPNSSNRIGNGW